MEINTQNKDSRWVALDIKDMSIIISEGKHPLEVIEEADIKVSRDNYILSFVPDPSVKYVF